MSVELSQLLEMGWSKEHAERALRETDYKGLEAALEWIIEHPPTEQETNTCIANTKEGDLTAQTDVQPPLLAQSYKCEDCGRHFKLGDEIQMHSARTGHVNFTESTDEIKPLTEEEKKAQIIKIQEYLRQKKVQREEEARVRQLDDEKHRRQQGKTIVSAKIKFQEDEMRRVAEEKKREKADDRAYREKLRAEMAREKAEKFANVNTTKLDTSQTINVASKLSSPKPVVSTPSECRLQIRTPTGDPLIATFQPKETLSAVILYASQHWPGAPSYGIDTREISLLVPYPKRKFTDTDLSSSLESLGLCPSSVLIAQLK